MSVEVRSELVGTVIEIGVLLGGPVRAGEVVAVLESMKMEIPLLSEGPGVVRSLPVAVGDVVRSGDVVAVIGAPESGPGWGGPHPEPAGRPDRRAPGVGGESRT